MHARDDDTLFSFFFLHQIEKQRRTRAGDDNRVSFSAFFSFFCIR